MMELETTPLVDGLVFPEDPRWHDEKLWFSDIHAQRVMTVDSAGRTDTVVDVPDLPSGLGWLPDGRLLMVSALERRLLGWTPRGLTEVADLRPFAPYPCNDMVVDSHGRAYVGHLGYDVFGGQPLAPGTILLAQMDGSVQVVAKGLHFPNGTVLTPDGSTLVVSETYAGRLTAFRVTEDGSLRGRRVWASLEGRVPDGICLDAEGAVWVASPATNEVVRVCEGGAITHRIPCSLRPYACMLGGEDRCTLFVLLAATDVPEEARALKSGRIETVPVTVPGVGLP